MKMMAIIMNTSAIKNDNDKKLILVVEDKYDMNELICAVMRNAGFDTISALDGKQGVKMAAELIPDLILMDIKLPKMDGITACEYITKSAKTTNVPVIMVSAKIDVRTKLAAFIAGAKRYITKPFGVEELVEEVRRTFRQKIIVEKIAAYRGNCEVDGNFGVLS